MLGFSSFQSYGNFTQGRFWVEKSDSAEFQGNRTIDSSNHFSNSNSFEGSSNLGKNFYNLETDKSLGKWNKVFLSLQVHPNMKNYSIFHLLANDLF
jgi:hypothetical protein